MDKSADTIQYSQHVPSEVFGEISAHVGQWFIYFYLAFVSDSYGYIYQVSPTYFIKWIATYPVDNAIHHLNNWGLICTLLCTIIYPWISYRDK